MTTALLRTETTADTLWTAHLLCQVCELKPWTQPAVRHYALICADCAAGEPYDDDA